MTTAINMKKISELELIKQVGVWAEANFGEHRMPEFGIMEEIGEAAHCVLKHIQKIRGMEKKETFDDKFGDALADTVIFLADWCSIHNAYFQLSRCERLAVEVRTDGGERTIINSILQSASIFFSVAVDSPIPGKQNVFGENLAQRLVQGLSLWADYYELDLSILVANVWVNTVSKRDWKKDPSGKNH